MLEVQFLSSMCSVVNVGALLVTEHHSAWSDPQFDDSSFHNRILIYIHFFSIQVRDEYRTDFDGGRGGYGEIIQQKVSTPIQDVTVFNR